MKVPTTLNIRFTLALLLAALALPVQLLAQPESPPDANGILLKPIPDKLVVLTFDDAPASHATVVAPILKSLGLGGSFYVRDFDSFRTRKDWYLTYRQMKSMAEDGFEIGNHTLGHGGGLENYLRMEDQLIANHVPKPTTVCWPIYHAAPSIYQDLSKHGYTFGRGGHERPYRPTVDNPFDVSLNSFGEGNRQTNSSLGVPRDIEAGEIVIGEPGMDGDCALIYTGPGETIQTDGHLLTVMRYVERNPVRANFVELVEDWQWSSAYTRRRPAAKVYLLGSRRTKILSFT